MHTLNEADRKVCSAQGDLFEASASLYACSSAIFIRRFMNSRVAERIDDGGFLEGASTPEGVFAELDEEYGASVYGSVKYSAEELHWIGYLYRYWCLLEGISSKRAFKIAGAREMRDLYFPYHTLRPESAVERILEAKGVPPESDEGFTERGVAILKRLRSQTS